MIKFITSLFTTQETTSHINHGKVYFNYYGGSMAIYNIAHRPRMLRGY